MVAAGTVVTRGAAAAALRVGDGEGEHSPGCEALGDGREQELGGDEADGAEDGVDRVELLVGGVQVVQCVAGDEGEVVQPSVVGAGAADLEADQVDACDVGAVAGGEVGGVVAGAAAEFQESLAAQVGAEGVGSGTLAGSRGPFHPGGYGEGFGEAGGGALEGVDVPGGYLGEHVRSPGGGGRR